MTDPIRALTGMRRVTRPGGVVAAAFEAGGLRSVEPASLSIRMEYTGFSDYWEPVANAQGPVGDYVKQLARHRLQMLAAAVRQAYLGGRPVGPVQWQRLRGPRSAWFHDPLARQHTAPVLQNRPVSGRRRGRNPGAVRMVGYSAANPLRIPLQFRCLAA